LLFGFFFVAHGLPAQVDIYEREKDKLTETFYESGTRSRVSVVRPSEKSVLYSVQPKRGRALVFNHDVKHEGRVEGKGGGSRSREEEGRGQKRREEEEERNGRGERGREGGRRKEGRREGA
jgi:hypothetical protein